MSLQLDQLKSNDEEFVVYNNTTGRIAGGFFDLKTFKELLFSDFTVNDHEVKKYFTYDEIADFFNDNGLEYSEKELKQLMEAE